MRSSALPRFTAIRKIPVNDTRTRALSKMTRIRSIPVNNPPAKRQIPSPSPIFPLDANVSRRKIPPGTAPLHKSFLSIAVGKNRSAVTATSKKTTGICMGIVLLLTSGTAAKHQKTHSISILHSGSPIFIILSFPSKGMPCVVSAYSRILDMACNVLWQYLPSLRMYGEQVLCSCGPSDIDCLLW